MKGFASLVAEHFKLAPDAIVDTLTAQDIPEWDSMNYLLLIADLEKAYGITFSMDEVLNSKTLGDLRQIVEARKA